MTAQRPAEQLGSQADRKYRYFPAEGLPQQFQFLPKGGKFVVGGQGTAQGNSETNLAKVGHGEWAIVRGQVENVQGAQPEAFLFQNRREIGSQGFGSGMTYDKGVLQRKPAGRVCWPPKSYTNPASVSAPTGSG